MPNGVDELFHALGILRKEAVVLNAGLYALLLGIFRHLAVSLCEDGQHRVKAAAELLIVRIAGRGVVAHQLAP